VPHLVPPLRPGKGAALRTGFFASRGKIIAFTDADLPYDLGFLEDAFRRLDQGFDLVTANRRSPESRFDIPTALLPVAYSRHRLGLLFNRVVRFLLPLPTRDTQSGMKVMSRKLATLAFSRLRCPGFFFDLEIFLTARTHGLAHAEMPITLRLNTEKSTVRVLRESVLAAYWLFRVWTGFLTGYYGRPAKREGILGNYKNLSLGNRFFLTIRWWLTPYDKMAAYIPQKGLVYDLGCGHGLFSMELAKTAPGRQVIGLDHDSARIQIAKSAAQSVRNLRFENGDLADAERYGHPDAISIIDVLHYFDFSTQEAHLAKAWRLLSQSGVLIFREVDPEGGLISKWNRYYEKIATSVGLTQSKEQDLFFRSTDDWLEILSRAGFRARAERCSHFLFADVLFIAEKKPESVA
jgi:SAM-dependent methyltransferase